MSLCDDIRELEENLSLYGRFIDEIAQELECHPDNEQILTAISDMKDRLKNAAEAAPVEVRRWPDVGDTYWYITAYNAVSFSKVLSPKDYDHEKLRLTGNCYRTKADARRMAQARVDLAALRRAEDGDEYDSHEVYGAFGGTGRMLTGRGFRTIDRRDAFVNSLGENKDERLSAIAEYLFGPK